MMIFRIKTMPRNRVQHQKGLSDDAFEQRYPDEEACRKAWFAWRWPEGFKCPRCAQTEYSEIRNRQLLQCRRCRYQTSLIAGTILQGTKLPMRVWFRAMHLLAQGKKGLSNIELGRRLGISTNAAWRLQHKLMQAMLERDRRYKVSLRGRPPFRDWRNDRGLGLSISAGDGKCPQARLWAQVCGSSVGTGRGQRS
jgi:transposase-like protein